MSEKFDGYIDKIRINGKTYAIKTQITEIHPMTCPKCGFPLELHYGEGKCNYCGTSYTSRFVVEEK